MSPFHSDTGCDRCKFQIRATIEGILRARGESGKWIDCLHPGERSEAERITGLGFEEALASGRARFFVFTLCLRCLRESAVPHGEALPPCPKCGETALRRVADLPGTPCPRCGDGTLDSCVFAVS